MIETVAELLLVAEADAIVHGVSGYAMVAVWMCRECLFDTVVQLKRAAVVLPQRSQIKRIGN